MKTEVSVLVYDDFVLVRGTIETEAGEADVGVDMKEGSSFLGIPYEEWRKKGSGIYEMEVLPLIPFGGER